MDSGPVMDATGGAAHDAPHAEFRELSARDYQEICNLVAKYFRFVDLKMWPELRHLFTNDARFEGLWAAAGSPDTFVDNLHANLGPEVVTVHQGFSPDIAATEDGVARGVWAMSDYLRWPPGTRAYLGVGDPSESGIRGYGYYEHEYRRTENGWRISFLRLTRIRIDPIVGDWAEPRQYPVLAPSHTWVGQIGTSVAI